MDSLKNLFSKKKLRLSQSLGAFRAPGGDISPLYVFFEVSNEMDESEDPLEVVALGVFPKRAPEPVAGGELEAPEGREPPFTLAPGESVRFRIRAKTLARALKDAGYGGTPVVSLVATDAEGRERRKDFKLRVDEYLALKDE